VTTATQSTSDTSGFAVDTNANAGITNFSFYADGQRVGQVSAYFDGPENNTAEDVNTAKYENYFELFGQTSGGGWTRKYSQGDLPWGNGKVQYDDHPGFSFKDYGCATTVLAMALNIAVGGSGAFTDPGKLNMEKRVYDNNHDVDWEHTPNLYGLKWESLNISSKNALIAALRRTAQPIVLKVHSIKNCMLNLQGKEWGHFVLATGVRSDGTISINDPGCRTTQTLDFYPEFSSKGYVTRLSDIPGGISDQSAITFSANDIAELTVVNPAGKKTGFNGIGKQYLYDIPNSSYDLDYITSVETGDDPTPTTPYLAIISPENGTYLLLLTGMQDGSYSVEVSGYSTDGSEKLHVILSGDIKTGQQITYFVKYDSRPNSDVIVGPRILWSSQ
jgi:hypothetical protein